MRRVLIPTLVGATLAVVPAAPATAHGTGTVSTLTGAGVLDTAPATQAMVTPTDAHMTPDGVYYLADPANNRIRLVQGSDISTVAGSLPGYAGDGGPATAARLNDPHRLVLTGDGDVVVADRGNRRVRRIDAATGTITTIAGNGQAGTATPNAAATTQPVTPDDVTYDAAHDRVLIADSAANRVYELGANGKLGVVAGAGTQAALATPWSIAVAPDGALYVGGQSDVRRVDGGTATVVAGGGSTEPRTDGLPATAVAVAPVRSVAVHPDGTLFFGDQLAPSGELHSKVRTVGADGTLGSVPDPDCGTAAVEVHEVDLAGYVAITCGHVFWERAEGVWTRLAGDPRHVLPVPDGTPAADAGFRPGGYGLGVVADGDGYVFGHGHALYRLAGGTVSRLAGTGDEGWSPDGTPALEAKLDPCRGVTLLSDGTPVWAEGTRVRGVAGGVLTTLVGGAPGDTTTSFTEGMPARSFQPQSCARLAPLPGGDLVLAEGGGGSARLYRVDVSAGTLHVLTQQPCGPGTGGVVTAIAAAADTVVTWAQHALCGYDLATGSGRILYRDFAEAYAIAVAPDGRVVFETADGEAPFTQRLRVLAPDGAVTTLAEEGAAREQVTTLADTDYGYLGGLTVDGAGGVVWQDAQGWLRRLAPGWSVDPVPGVTDIAGTVTYAGDTASVTLTWTPPATGYDGIDVVAMPPPGGYAAQRKQLPAGTTSVTLTGLDAGLPYVFDVRPTRGGDAEMAPHHRFTAVTPTQSAPAEKPGLYVYSAGAGRTAALVWTAPPGGAASEVRLDGQPVHTGTGSGAVVAGLTKGQQYDVAVHAAGSATPAWTQTFVAGAAPRLVLTAGPGQGAWAPADVTYAWTVRGGATEVACTFQDEPAACDDHLTRTGLAFGTYHLALRATGPFGPLPVVERTVHVDPYAPTARVALPNPPVDLDGVTEVWNQSTDAHSGLFRYGLRYRRVHYGGLAGPYAYPASWQGTDASAQTLRGLKSGYTYCFSGRATDGAGNTSAWSAERCTSVPLDDRRLTASAGWTRTTRTGAYAGTVSRTTGSRRTLSLDVVTVGRVVLRATRCPTCGVVGVYLGGALRSKIDLYAPTVQRGVMINPGWFDVRGGTLTLKTLSSGELVEIDAVALSSQRY